MVSVLAISNNGRMADKYPFRLILLAPLVSVMTSSIPCEVSNSIGQCWEWNMTFANARLDGIAVPFSIDANRVSNLRWPQHHLLSQIDHRYA